MRDAVSLTDLIQRAQAGDPEALRSVFDATYDELHGLARARLSRKGRHTLLDTTSLVHESYLRFADSGRLNIRDRNHFMSYASHVMRSVIVDFVRERVTQRRGGDVAHVTLDSQIEGVDVQGESEILRVHEALDHLAEYDPRMVHVVEMRYFAGMTEAEIANALGVTDRTVRRDWEKARLLLKEELK